jgi:hypothetical protein
MGLVGQIEVVLKVELVGWCQKPKWTVLLSDGTGLNSREALVVHAALFLGPGEPILMNSTVTDRRGTYILQVEGPILIKNQFPKNVYRL